MTSAFGFLKTWWRGGDARLHELQAEGRTLEVDALAATDLVVEVGLGFGPEFWSVHGDYRVDPRRALIEHGSLIMENGRPLSDRQRLAFLRQPVERLIWKD